MTLWEISKLLKHIYVNGLYDNRKGKRIFEPLDQNIRQIVNDFDVIWGIKAGKAK